MRFTNSMRPALLLTALAASSLLGACAPLLIGGAMVGGSMMVTDRRTSGTQLEDQGIEMKAAKRAAEAISERGHINLTSYNRLVLITGEAPTEADKAAVELAVARVENVRSVVNDLVIGSASSIGNRSNDTLLTSKVKASMVDAKDVLTNAYKVVTERRVVYLMGRVSEREAVRATGIARGVGGVAKVVRLFEIVSEAELADAQAKPAAKP